MGKTSIEWTDRSINPLRATDRKGPLSIGHHCEKVSPGCQNCYASQLQARFCLPEFGGPSRREVVRTWLDPDKLREVMRRKKPTKWFWCDMTDLFGDWVTNEDINRCFAAMALTPQHTHQVLTKRPERMREYMADPGRAREVSYWMAGNAMIPAQYRDGYLPPWPPPNVWLGVSVEDQQRAAERIPLLLQTPARVRFLSVEPLLGPVDLTAVKVGCAHNALYCACSAPGCGHTVVDWVIVGGESGPHARPCHIDWLRVLVRQCGEAALACFVKQLGDRPVSGPPLGLTSDSSGVSLGFARLALHDSKGGDMAEWPDDLRVRQFPSVALPPGAG